MELLDMLNISGILVSALITTLLVGAVHAYLSEGESEEDKKKKKQLTRKLVPLFALVVTVARTTFISGATFADWQNILISMFATMAFAVLFYLYLGEWFVDRLVTKVKAWLVKMSGGDNPPPPAIP